MARAGAPNDIFDELPVWPGRFGTTALFCARCGYQRARMRQIHLATTQFDDVPRLLSAGSLRRVTLGFQRN
jgi:hypothetical protein